MTIHENLLADVEAFLKLSGMPESTFGRGATGHWGLVTRIRRGDDLRISTVERVRAFIEAETARILRERAATAGSPADAA